MLRLKPLPADGAYDPATCAASRCSAEALLLDGTQTLAPCAVPLCEHHWEIRSELERTELAEKAAIVTKLKRQQRARDEKARAQARQLSFRFVRKG